MSDNERKIHLNPSFIRGQQKGGSIHLNPAFVGITAETSGIRSCKISDPKTNNRISTSVQYNDGYLKNNHNSRYWNKVESDNSIDINSYGSKSFSSFSNNHDHKMKWRKEFYTKNINSGNHGNQNLIVQHGEHYTGNCRLDQQAQSDSKCMSIASSSKPGPSNYDRVEHSDSCRSELMEKSHILSKVGTTSENLPNCKGSGELREIMYVTSATYSEGVSKLNSKNLSFETKLNKLDSVPLEYKKNSPKKLIQSGSTYDMSSKYDNYSNKLTKFKVLSRNKLVRRLSRENVSSPKETKLVKGRKGRLKQRSRIGVTNYRTINTRNKLVHSINTNLLVDEKNKSIPSSDVNNVFKKINPLRASSNFDMNSDLNINNKTLSINSNRKNYITRNNTIYKKNILRKNLSTANTRTKLIRNISADKSIQNKFNISNSYDIGVTCKNKFVKASIDSYKRNSYMFKKNEANFNSNNKNKFYSINYSSARRGKYFLNKGNVQNDKMLKFKTRNSNSGDLFNKYKYMRKSIEQNRATPFCNSHDRSIRKRDLKPGTLIEIVKRKKKMNFMNKRNDFCLFFSRHGKCLRYDRGLCPFIHDPRRITICTRFLNNAKCNINSCPFSHTYDATKMPVCSHFLKGSCTREKCPFRHVRVNPKAPICTSFLKGFCPEGEECKNQHVWICPEFETSGVCASGKKCPLPHKINKLKLLKGKKIKTENNEIYRNFEGKQTNNDNIEAVPEKTMRYFEQDHTVSDNSNDVDTFSKIPQSPHFKDNQDSMHENFGESISEKRLRMLAKVEKLKKSYMVGTNESVIPSVGVSMPSNTRSKSKGNLSSKLQKRQILNKKSKILNLTETWLDDESTNKSISDFKLWHVPLPDVMPEYIPLELPKSGKIL